jgi:sugar phosphate isomerase/epimerase
LLARKEVSLSTVDRRRFLSALAAGVAAPAIVRARGQKLRLPISFSTLGCPDWTWKQILSEADRLGYRGIEIRGLEGEMDLPRWPGFQGRRLGESRQDVAALGLVITDLGASSNMHLKDPGERRRQLDEGRRFVDLAHDLGVPYVRMFGDKIPPGEPRDEVMKRVVDGFREMAAHAQAAGVVVIIESHGDFTRSDDLEEILTRVDSEAFALLWDAHHTFVSAGEAPAQTWKRLGPSVRHTHLKDSVPDGEGRRYVLTGTGDVPVKEQVKVLVAGGYDGFYGLEWEKKWHPEIEPPEVAFPQYATTVGEYLAEAGVRPS